jgi:hypothetical protein
MKISAKSVKNPFSKYLRKTKGPIKNKGDTRIKALSNGVFSIFSSLNLG